MACLKEKLAAAIYDIGAVKFGKFKLKLHENNPDAPLSPIYIDLRIIRSFPEVMGQTIEVFKELISGEKFDLLADVPTAATPFTAILAYELKLPMVSPRQDVKSHGTKRKIEGVFQKGQTVLLIDDLITNAESKLESIAILEAAGLIVKTLAVLIDREQGGFELLASRGYKCTCAFGLRELLDFLLRLHKIDRPKYDETISYLKNAGKK